MADPSGEEPFICATGQLGMITSFSHSAERLGLELFTCFVQSSCCRRLMFHNTGNANRDVKHKRLCLSDYRLSCDCNACNAWRAAGLSQQISAVA